MTATASAACKHGVDLSRSSCGNCRAELTAPWRASRNPDRAAAYRFAREHGFFWLPCPRCGEWFGGQEWGSENVRCLRDSTVGHGACCAKKSDENDRDACRRDHEANGE